MKAVVVFASVHKGNTRRVAEAIARELHAKAIPVGDARDLDLSNYDLVGFGSGVYFRRHHQKLLKFIDALPKCGGRKAFVFSTSGFKELPVIQPFSALTRKKLLEKGFEVVGEFSCRGFDCFGPFKLIGGLNKGRPSESDLSKARWFACGLTKE